jgi:3D (Asp-Asp-Asp) domain-containing protein
VTVVPEAMLALQVLPQVIALGLEVTVPEPVPALVTVRAKVCTPKVAVMPCAELIVTVHVPVPLHPAPLQPVKAEPALAAAVRVTLVPLLKMVLQVEPQVIPLGAEVTVPEPVPLFVTVRP